MNCAHSEISAKSLILLRFSRLTKVQIIRVFRGKISAHNNRGNALQTGKRAKKNLP